MQDSPLLYAMLLGLFSAASLPLGALLGVYWRPGDRAMAFFLAFGAGALLAALGVELVAESVAEGQVLSLTLGAVLGGLAFKGLNFLVNRRGGYLRKPSTAISYWKHKAAERFRSALSDLARAPVLSAFTPEQLALLLPHVLVRELPAGSTIYRPGDPAENLYVIERGGVDLLDAKAGRRAFAHLGPKGVFGRLSFITGMPRGTEAVTTEETRLLILPRGPFFDAVEEQPSLWESLAQRLKSDEVLTFLREREDMSQDRVLEWSAAAVAQVRAEGRFTPPLRSRPEPDDLVGELTRAQRTSFFSGLPEAELEAIAARLIPKSATAGHTFFHIGERGERLYLLRRGHVSLLDPQDPARRPTDVGPGQVFGRHSFFTGGQHTVTAVASQDCDVLVLRRKDFDDLILERPALGEALGTYLRGAGVADYLTKKQAIAPEQAAAWLDRAVQHVQRGQLFPTLTELKSEVGGHAGAAIAILLGVLLDGVPEALVIGAGTATGGAVSIALLGSIFISNFPEALSSAAGLREQGFKTARILGMWFALMLMTALVSGFGALTMQQAPEPAYALIEGFAAGAILTVVAETMLPEAYHRGGGIVGLSTLTGFLVAVLLSAAG